MAHDRFENLNGFIFPQRSGRIQLIHDIYLLDLFEVTIYSFDYHRRFVLNSGYYL